MARPQGLPHSILAVSLLTANRKQTALVKAVAEKLDRKEASAAVKSGVNESRAPPPPPPAALPVSTQGCREWTGQSTMTSKGC